MAETRNKRILSALGRERRENARRYWAAKRNTPLSGCEGHGTEQTSGDGQASGMNP